MCPPDQQPSLEWLISPVARQTFFAEYWEKQPLVVKRARPEYFRALLSLDEVDRALTTLDLRYPNVRVKNADSPITSADYTLNGDSLDIARVYQLFGEGATLVLSYLDNTMPALAAFCRSLENEFSFPFQTNVYLTPPRAKGFKAHYDTHDVFVLQVAGTKRWTVYGTPVELPLSGQDFDSAIHARGEPTFEFELGAGDVAYVPRGAVHDARSGETVSLHVTAGVLAPTWADLLLEWVADAALRDPAFRRALPPAFARQEFDRARAGEMFRDLARRLSGNLNLDDILDRFISEFLSACPPQLRGQMAQIAAIGSLTPESLIGARPGVAWYLRSGEGTASVECYGRRIVFPARATDALRFALTHARVAVRELPGDLDDAGKLALARRLIREGLVAVLADQVAAELPLSGPQG